LAQANLTEIEDRHLEFDLDATTGGQIMKLLRDLNHVYAEMAHAKNTDYDTLNYHNGEICNILELVGRQVFYQVDKDWHYRTE